MNLNFDSVYYEPDAIEYPLGKALKQSFSHLPWREIESHNRIPEFSSSPNRDFARLKRHLIVGIRKTHNYVENHKVSDYLVPYTSSGCSAMCLYCYLVCNYNKCAYLRLFVNREQMLNKLLRADAKAIKPMCFEIGSNSDLVLENIITGNLQWTIESFGKTGRGRLTFPTKFHQVDSLLNLEHKGKIIFRMSMNPQEIISRIELGTSCLEDRIKALNKMCMAGYPVGILIAPVILLPGWEELYGEMISRLEQELCPQVKDKGFIEIIFMTYSYVQNAINQEAFPQLDNLLNRESMTGRGRGKYCYRAEHRGPAEEKLKAMLANSGLKHMPILYIA